MEDHIYAFQKFPTACKLFILFLYQILTNIRKENIKGVLCRGKKKDQSHNQNRKG